MFRIYVYSEADLETVFPGWRDSGEGPFDTAAEAIAFARAECGCAWVVVNAQMYPIAFGDALQHFGRIG